MTLALPLPLSRTQTTSDLADVASAASGDRSAFARLVPRYRNAVSSSVVSVIGDPAAADEIAQEVFLAAWTALPGLRDPRSFPAWLRTMAKNHARDALRARRRRPATAADVDAIADSGPAADDVVARLEDARKLSSALTRLSVDDREVLILFYLEDQSLTDVAALLGISEPAARKRLSRAREHLRDEFDEKFATRLLASAPGVFLLAVSSALGPQAARRMVPLSMWAAAATVMTMALAIVTVVFTDGRVLVAGPVASPTGILALARLPASPQTTPALAGAVKPPVVNRAYTGKDPGANPYSEGHRMFSEQGDQARRSMEEDPGNLDAHARFLGYSSNRGNPVERIEQIVWLAENYPGDKRVGLPMLVVKSGLDPEGFARVDAAWRRAVAQHPNDAAVLYNAAQVQFGGGDHEAARAWLRTAAEVSADPVLTEDALSLLADLAPEDPATALATFDEAVARTKEPDASLLQRAAKAALDAGKFDAAIVYARRALAAEPNPKLDNELKHEAHIVLGQAALAKDDLATARVELLLAAAVTPTNYRNAMGPDLALARALAAKGEKEYVRRYITACRPLWPSGAAQLDAFEAEIR